MNMRRTTLLKSLLLLFTVTGCTPATIPVRQQTETEFTLGYETCYGDYYQPEGIGRNVVMLDIFGRRLDQDSIGRLVGTGTNFGFTDVFYPRGPLPLNRQRAPIRPTPRAQPSPSCPAPTTTVCPSAPSGRT